MHRRLQKTNKNQYILTVPKALVELLKWNDKDEIEFELDNNLVRIKKKGEQKFGCSDT